MYNEQLHHTIQLTNGQYIACHGVTMLLLQSQMLWSDHQLKEDRIMHQWFLLFSLPYYNKPRRKTKDKLAGTLPHFLQQLSGVSLRLAMHNAV